MKLRYLAFSDRGEALANRLARDLPGTVSRCGAPPYLADWTRSAFREADGLIYVGAAGIAVRAIAPHVRDKARDPAVVVMDEGGCFAVPLLSGHLGGANDLARALHRVCGAAAVITTATDVRGVFAVDEWAKRQNCTVTDAKKIKTVSARLLAGETVNVYSPWAIAGECPPGVTVAGKADCHVCLSVEREETAALVLTPRILTLGIGCRRGTSCAALEDAFARLLAESRTDERAVCGAASIDLKKDEPGLEEFCRAHGWDCAFFTARELSATEGDFAPSEFVKEVTGVDNVCERSAVAASHGTLYRKKYKGSGVTMALGLAPYHPTWRWQDNER